MRVNGSSGAPGHLSKCWLSPPFYPPPHAKKMFLLSVSLIREFYFLTAYFIISVVPFGLVP